MRKPQDDVEPTGRQQRQETFEEHLERMRIFRKAHDASAAAAEFQAILPILVKIGYLLNMIHRRNTVVLPENWQN